MNITAVSSTGRPVTISTEELVQRLPRTTVSTSLLVEILSYIEELPGKYYKVLAPAIQGMIAGAVEEATKHPEPDPED